jgi:hypothetical protein
MHFNFSLIPCQILVGHVAINHPVTSLCHEKARDGVKKEGGTRKLTIKKGSQNGILLINMKKTNQPLSSE